MHDEIISYLIKCFTLQHQQYHETYFYLPLLEFKWPQERETRQVPII
jgi:hypothetical protein